MGTTIEPIQRPAAETTGNDSAGFGRGMEKVRRPPEQEWIEEYGNAPGDLNRLWRDERFQELDDRAKLMVFYCLTGDQTQELGIQKFSPTEAAEDLRWSVDDARTCLRAVVERFDWQWDPQARLLWLPDFSDNVRRPTCASIRRTLRRTAGYRRSPVLLRFLIDAFPAGPLHARAWRASVTRFHPSLIPLLPPAPSPPASYLDEPPTPTDTKAVVPKTSISKPPKARPTSAAAETPPRAVSPSSASSVPPNPPNPPSSSRATRADPQTVRTPERNEVVRGSPTPFGLERPSEKPPSG